MVVAAIDLENERLMRIRQVPGYLAERGVTCSLRAVYDWIYSGKLRSGRIGGIRHTSREALQDMLDGQPGGGSQSGKPARRTSKERLNRKRRAQEDAEAEKWLRERGVL